MNYYETLGVPESATQDDIKKAFREKAKTTHPDTNRADKTLEDKFKQISEAYDTLSDEQKRKQYDHTLKYGANQQQGFDPFSMFGGGFDAFSQMFNFRFNESQENKKITPIKVKFIIDIFKAFTGYDQEVTITRDIFCKTCGGSGDGENCETVKCSRCNGSGLVEERMHPNAMFVLRQPCPSCMGKGISKTSHCKKCSGTGIEKESEHVKIHVPKGLQNGDRMTIRNKGNEYEKGKYSDLIVIVEIKEHEFYKLKGQDVYVEMPIPVHSVLCEEEIEVPTLHGFEKIKINKNSLEKNYYTIKGKGYSQKDSTSFGNQHVYFNFEFPTNISKELKDSLKSINIDKYPKYQAKIRR